MPLVVWRQVGIYELIARRIEVGRMPLPVAHAMVGATIVASLSADSRLGSNWKALLLGAGLAVLPDFDLIFVWVLGFSARWHGGVSHSLLVALAGGLLGAAVLPKPTKRLAITLSLAMASHGILDAATIGRWGGVGLFWPFWRGRIKIGSAGYFEFFPNPATDRFFDLVLRGLTISAYELAIFSPLLVLVLWIRHRTAVKAQCLSN